MAATPSATEFYEHTCECGCGKRISVRPHHRYDGIPRFAKGHREGNVIALRWAAQEQGRHFCQCGCGEPIEVVRAHHWRGIPRFRQHHAQRIGKTSWNAGLAVPKPERRNFSFADRVRILIHCGFKCVGCGETTLERLEFDHVIAVAAGGETVVENGQVLCTTCHRAKSRQDISAAARAASERRHRPTDHAEGDSRCP